MNRHFQGAEGDPVILADQQEPGVSKTQVGVHLRVVPAGVESIDGRMYMRAAVLISPGPRGGRACANVDLEKWPFEIEKLLFGELEYGAMHLRMDIQQASANLVCPSPNVLVEVQRAAKFDPVQRAADLRVISSLWTELVGVDEFATLAKSLNRSNTSQNSEVLKRLDPGVADKKVDGAVANSGPAVVNAARNLLGIILPLERAQTLKTRLAELGMGKSAMRPPETNLAYVPFEPYDLDQVWPSYLGEPPLLRKLAQSTVGDVKSDGPSIVLFNDSAKSKILKEELDRAGSVANSVESWDLKAVKDARRAASQGPAIPSASGPDRALSSALNSELDRHVLSTTRADENIDANIQTIDAEGRWATQQSTKTEQLILQNTKAQQRLAAIQNQPSLARLFNMVCDVLVPWGDDFLKGWLSRDSAYFGIVSAGLKADENRLWTATKFRLVPTPDAWPCTTDEVVIQLGDFKEVSVSDGSVEQLDGFLPLNAGDKESGFRYEIVTIDVERASEQRLAVEAARFIHSTDLNDKDAPVATMTDEGNRLLTLRTAGFAIADKQRAIDVTRTIRRSSLRQGEASCVIGAEDLTVGYRLDVSMPTAKTDKRWRTLCNRSIQFGDDRSSAIESILRRLAPDPVRRADFDSAIIAPATRLDGVGSAENITAYVEDQIARWLGLPLGVDTDNDPGYELENGVAWNSAIPLYARKGALPLSQTFSLTQPRDWPKNRSLWNGVPLAFGTNYAFRMRAVLNGGIVRPASYRHGQSLPANGGYRFRRHERIERPVVSTPELFLRGRFDRVRDGVRETGGSAILRSLVGAVPDDPRWWRRTVRLFSPPPVALEFAELHSNAFGEKPKEIEYRKLCNAEVESTSNKFTRVKALVWKAPEDGMRNLHYSHPAGGFPVFTFDRHMDGELDRTGLIAPQPWVKPNGDAVCIPVSNDRVRAEPYYPDPAAEFMVFGLRDASGRFTPDPPVVVRLRAADKPATACRPVAVELVAGKRHVNGPARTRIWTGEGEAPLLTAGLQPTPPLASPLYMDKDGAISKEKPKNAPAIEVSRLRVELAPGEQFRLEAWCIPSEATLAKLFEVVNGLAMLGDPANYCMPTGDKTEAEKVCSPAHLPPQVEVVAKCARACFSELVRGPIPEISATAHVEVIHALDKPFEAPESDLKLIRLHADQLPKALSWNGVDQPHEESLPVAPSTLAQRAPVCLPDFFGVDSEGKPLAIVPGGGEVLLSGDLTVDRKVTGFFEIDAIGACLISGRFDDPARKRTDSEVLRGIWPVDPAYVDDVSGKPPGKTIRSIYGFDVDAQGRVTHPLEKATLLRVDDSPELTTVVSGPPDMVHQLQFLQKSRRNLRKIQAIAKLNLERPEKLFPRASHPGQISGTLARIVMLEAVAGSRSSNMFRHERSGAVYSGPDATRRSKRSARHAIPSTASPPAVVPISIVPSFKFAREVSPDSTQSDKTAFKVVVTRHVRLRIRLQRPWFQSGEGERLGIVLWPPDLSLRNRDRTDGDLVQRDNNIDLGFPNRMSQMALRALEDHKMPPEWSYVTRWGMDPIRRRETRHPWVVPPNAMRDIARPDTRWHDSVYPPENREWNILGDFLRSSGDKTQVSEIERDVVFVGRALVPFPEAREDKPAGPAYGAFEAALLTYRPRFDLDQECWYCDVEIDPKGASFPFIRLGLVRYQPLAPRELQVSAPVVEWSQLPPGRKVTVAPSSLSPHAVIVEARGSGAALSEQAPAESVFSWLQQPALKVTLCWRYEDGREVVARLGAYSGGGGRDIYHANPHFSPFADFTYIPQSQQDWDEYLSIEPPDPEGFQPLKKRAALRRTDTDAPSDVGDVVWRATIILDRPPTHGPDGAWLVVHVEEVEPMLPASYPEEPFDENDPELAKARRIEVSGPKFAASVDYRRRI